jgi:hypothetical protein
MTQSRGARQLYGQPARSNRASTLGTALGSVGDGAVVARLAVCALAGRCGTAAAADSGGVGHRHLQGAGVDRGGALSHVGRAAPMDAACSGVVGFSGTECADIRRGGWKTGSMVFQFGCRECRGCGDRAGVVSSAVFSGAHVVRGSRRLDLVQQRKNASRCGGGRVAGPISAGRRSVRAAARDRGAFFDRAILLVCCGLDGTDFSRRNSSPALAVANCRSRFPAEHDDGSFRPAAARGATLAALGAAAGCSGVATAPDSVRPECLMVPGEWREEGKTETDPTPTTPYVFAQDVHSIAVSQCRHARC